MKKEEFELILDEGEGYLLEFKRSVSDLDKEMVAFANSSGGRIFLGIRDNKEVNGIKIDNGLKSRIQDIANNCEPAVKIFLEEYGNVLIISVRQGEEKPYKCASGFYTRVGPNSQKLSRNEIVDFFKSEGRIRYDELVNLNFDFDEHFDFKKFDRFLRMAGISKVMDEREILMNLGVAEKQEGRMLFNNTGILFFSKNLADIYFHTAVTCALYKGVDKEEILDRKEFNEDIVGNIDGAINFLKQYTRVRYEMTGEPRRKEIPEIPYEALREAVVNAVAHRDYFEKGSNVMVEIFDDRIEIFNFGGLVKGLRKEDFGKKSVLRNPNIANLLNRIGYIEKMGTGIVKMQNAVQAAGLAPIQFEFSTFFTTVFRRSKEYEEVVHIGKEKYEKIMEKIDGVLDRAFKDKVKRESVERYRKILILLYEKPKLNMPKLVVGTGIPLRTLQRDMAILGRKGIVIFVGARKSGGYLLSDGVIVRE